MTGAREPLTTSILNLPKLDRETHAFDPERPVERADRTALLAAARRAPSWNNSQPWRLLLCDRSDHPDAWEGVFESLLLLERAWAYRAGIFVVACTEADHERGPSRQRAFYDTGIAAEHLCLEALARHLATHVTTGFDEGRLRAALSIPHAYECVSIVAVGHPADTGTLGRDLYLRELALRRREPLAGRLFEGAWDSAWLPTEPPAC